jgi:hypothetical protein
MAKIEPFARAALFFVLVALIEGESPAASHNRLEHQKYSRSIYIKKEPKAATSSYIVLFDSFNRFWRRGHFETAATADSLSPSTLI